MGPHAYNTIKYMTGKAELSEEEKKMLEEKQKELGIKPVENQTPNDVRLLKPEEFPKYNLTYPSDLDIIEFLQNKLINKSLNK